jgi:peptide/nickel transport system substrate-binding protein
MLTSLGPGLAYSRLLRLRAGPELDQPSLRLECDLCQSWEVTPDLVYEFQLRPGIRWQNIPPVGGRLLDAEDLVFSYERLRTPGWPNAGLFTAIESIEAPDAETLRVKLASPDADALLSLADGHSKIVAREVVAQYGDLKTGPVIGTGPWIWEETGADKPMTLVRNPGYFEERAPLIDQLVVPVIKQSGLDRSGQQERLAAFQAGLVDVVLVPPRQWTELRASEADFESVVARQSGTGVMLSLNVQAPVLSSVDVRRAIFKAIDPWEYIDTIWGGQGYASVGIPVQDPDWLLGRAEIRREHFADPSEARKLLAAWGGPQPVDIELTVRTEKFGEIYLDLEERLAGDLRAVGFNPRVRRLNPVQFGESVAGRDKDYQVAIGVLPPTSTTNSFLLALLHSGGRWNMAAHQDNKLDGMIERQAVEFDPARRRTQLREIQRYVLDRGYLFSPITGASRWVFSPQVKGFHPNSALSEYIYWSRVWLDR